MQNTPQTFRGVGAPGVNFNEHSYDNHVGGHCQPAGYQPYSSPPYHPIPSPRPHHYGNHQMQQSMPYRHHGGAYAPNQNQYGQNMNQEMYRNHHSGYVPSPNNRNMPAKSWSENNAPADLMPPYGQVSHPQMMSNPAQMPVNAMRSPPHATSNMNPAPPQNPQHFRQMQSPAHSPHSWSQAQIPSPGVMRTTPSPAHVRSPGHSQQPFSPPMNMPPHPQPPENGQVPPAINSSSGMENPSNPLHSLQKMVMLDQDPSKAIMPMMGDGGEQFPNQCGPHNYLPEDGASNESKDSSYSTYYNMDENRFESKPNNTSTDAAAYSSVQQVSNCNFPVPPHPLNSDEAKGSASTSMPDGLSSDHSSLSSSKSSPSSVPLMLCSSNAGTNDPSLNLGDCPPHAESAPVFTDQTQAAVSNSEQALESKVSSNSSCNVLPGDKETPAVDIPNSQVAGEPVSSRQVNASIEMDVAKSPVRVKSEDSNQKEKVSNPPSASDVSHSDDKNTKEDENTSSQNFDIKCKKEICDPEITSNEKYNPAIIKVQAEVHNSDIDTELVSESTNKETCDTKKDTAKCNESEVELLASSSSVKVEKDDEMTSVKVSPKCDSSSDDQDIDDAKAKELARNPVKVVIHRIRKDDTNDTWHVPGNESGDENNSETSVNKKPETGKVPHVGPQIVILSPAVSQKKYGFQSSVAENNVITIDEEDSVEAIDTEESQDKSLNTKGGSNSSPSSNAGAQSPDKKRGRPVGSKNKLKPSAAVKKKKGGKGSRKKKSEPSGKSKVAEIPSKPKKVKIFSGPYVHIVGSKENPSSIKVINVAQKEEEKVNKPSTVKRNFPNTVNRIKKKPVGHLSTLSPTYDAFNKDKTWLCVFCHKGSHHGGLGDLYGPYYIKDNAKSCTASNSSGSGSARRKRCRSEADESRSSKKSKQASGHTPIESTPVKSAMNNSFSDSETSDLREVWIHEDCAVWCQSISLIGEEVQGLEEAVVEAREHICCKCSLHGATLGCWGKCCKEQYHYSCAKETGCQMDIENFSLLCPKHQKKIPRKTP